MPMHTALTYACLKTCLSETPHTLSASSDDTKKFKIMRGGTKQHASPIIKEFINKKQNCGTGRLKHFLKSSEEPGSKKAPFNSLHGHHDTPTALLESRNSFMHLFKPTTNTLYTLKKIYIVLNDLFFTQIKRLVQLKYQKMKSHQLTKQEGLVRLL